jgi:hypothetical protein
MTMKNPLRNFFKPKDGKREKAPPPQGVRMRGDSLEQFGFGMLAHLAEAPEGSFFYDIGAIGTVQSRVPTPWPEWDSDYEWALAMTAAAGGTRGAYRLLFGAELRGVER